MNDSITNKVHWSFWLITIIALIWNLLGAMNFLGQMNPEMVAKMPETHRAIIEARPAWGTAAFALAVFGGVIACVLLLFKKSIAFYVFIASLLGVIVQVIPHIDLVGSVIVSPFEIVMMIIMPFVVAIFLVWYSKWLKLKNWVQ